MPRPHHAAFFGIGGGRPYPRPRIRYICEAVADACNLLTVREVERQQTQEQKRREIAEHLLHSDLIGERPQCRGTECANPEGKTEDETRNHPDLVWQKF